MGARGIQVLFYQNIRGLANGLANTSITPRDL